MKLDLVMTDKKKELRSYLKNESSVVVPFYPENGEKNFNPIYTHLREVSPALDEAYREMERAVEKITSCCQACTVCAACELKDSLEKLREARK